MFKFCGNCKGNASGNTLKECYNTVTKMCSTRSCINFFPFFEKMFLAFSPVVRFFWTTLARATAVQLESGANRAVRSSYRRRRRRVPSFPEVSGKKNALTPTKPRRGGEKKSNRSSVNKVEAKGLIIQLAGLEPSLRGAEEEEEVRNWLF